MIYFKKKGVHMFRFIFLVLLALFFSSCSALSYSYNNKSHELVFNVSNDTSYTVKLYNPSVTPQFDGCSSFSYTLHDKSPAWGKLFIEHIDLHSNCQFNSETSGIFLYEFKENLKLKHFEPIEVKQYKNYEFYTYKINDVEYINFIYIFSPFTFTFIIDQKGVLSQEILQHFDASYHSSFLDKKRFETNYDYSLVKMNVFKGYFTKMSEDFSK